MKDFLDTFSHKKFGEIGSRISRNPPAFGGGNHETLQIFYMGVCNGWGYGIAFFASSEFSNSEPQRQAERV